MNKSIMMGRLVRDPEVNYTTKKDGDEFIVANFRIAVDRKYSDETDFFPCTAFGWLAEFVEKYLYQGIKIVITGRMENNNYTNKDGDKVYDDDDEDSRNRSRNSKSGRSSTRGKKNSGSQRSSKSSSGRSGRSSSYSSGKSSRGSSQRNRTTRNDDVDDQFDETDYEEFD